MNRKLNLIFNILIIALYIFITVFTMFHHEIWRDEAQVWLVVRDLNLFGIIDHVRYEGHPLLWYMIVLPFAKLGLPVIFMQAVSLIFMIAAALIFVFKSPFNIITKISILFSTAFIYWLSIISRNYSLIPFFVFTTALLYPKQKTHPYFYAISLALLSQTHVLTSAFCAGMGILFGYENIIKNKENKEKFVWPLLIIFLPLIILCLYIFSSQNQNASIVNFNEHGEKTLWKSFTSMLVYTYGYVSNVKGFFITALLLICSAVIFVENKKLFAVFLTSFVYQICVYTYIWQSSSEKAALFFVILIFCFWLILNTKKLSKPKQIVYNLLLITIFGINTGLGINLVKNDISYDYSGSKNTAKFIKENINKEDTIITNNPVFTSSIAAYLPDRKFYYEKEKRFVTFGYDIRKPEKTETTKGKKYYLYSSITVPEQKMLYKSKPYTLIATENFYISEDKLKE